MDKNLTFTTVEELVKYTLAHPSSVIRFSMSENNDKVFDNPQDGEAWKQLKRDATNRRWKFRRENPGCEDTAEYKKMLEDEEAIEGFCPPMHVESYLTLCETGPGYHKDYFYLKGELVDLVKGVWTYKERYGYLRPTGWLTLKGLLARLGKKDIGEQINKIIADQKAQDEKNARNYQRKIISEKAAELVKLVKQHSESLGLDLLDQIQLPELVKLVDHLED